MIIVGPTCPIQVIVGSFNVDGGRNKEPKPSPTQLDPVYAAPSRVSSGAGGGGIGASSPPWDGTMSESSGSPLHHHHGSGHGNNSVPQGMPWK